MNITILGTGVFGIALAKSLNNGKNHITMWTRFEEEAEKLNETRINKNMDDIIIDKNIIIESNLKKAVINAQIILIVIPTKFLNDIFKDLKNLINDEQHIIIASKGLDEDNDDLISNNENLIKISNNLAFISGPTFAHDLALKCPSGMTIASKNSNTISNVKEAFKNTNVFLEETDDINGVQLLGTIKNILAIIFGITSGLNCIASTNSLLLVKLLEETKSILNDSNSSDKTLYTLAGIGDIWLTCNNNESRNYTFGKLIASDNSNINEYIENNTIEGLTNLKTLKNMLSKQKKEYYFINILYNIIYNNANPQKILDCVK